ncbi:PQQ-dependent sugar dehydrogenase, partial [Catenovulum sediminis]
MSNKHRYIANSVFLPALTLLVSCLFSVSIFLKNADAAQSFSSQKHDFYLDEIASGFDTPWGLAFVTPNKLILTERDGDIFLLDLKAKNQKQISGHPKIESSGQGGLMDVALPSVKPENYQDKIRLYFTYSKSTEAGLATTLASAELVGQHLINWQDVLVTQSANDNTRHFGSRITFDGQGHLFFSIGDRAERENAQNLSNHAGAILRLTLDGKTPADNPFIDSRKALAEIWSYGHRNPQGLVFDKTHKRLWSIEHGPRGGDEINLIEKGKN